MAKQYARRQLVRGEDGLLNVAYIDIATGLPIDRGNISDYEIVDANSGSYWGDKGNRRNKDDEEDDKKKKKKKESIFDTNGDKPTQGIQTPGSEASKYSAYINATPTTKFSTTTQDSKTVTDPNTVADESQPDIEQGDTNATVTQTDGMVRSLDQTPSSMNTGPVSSVPSYNSKVSNSYVASPAETPGFVDYSVQPTSTRTLGLMEEVNRPAQGINYESVVDAGKGFTTVLGTDGNTYTVKGDFNTRNNNPGNIEDGNFARSQPGYIEGGGRFAAFKTLQDGQNAMTNLLTGPAYQNLTIKEAITKYAPPNENNTAGYIKSITDQTGITADTKISDLSPEDMGRVTSAMTTVEGMRPVTVYDEAGNVVENPFSSTPVSSTSPVMPGFINTNVQSTAGLLDTPDLPVNQVQTTSVPNYTESGLLPSVNPRDRVGVSGNTNAELGFDPSINPRSVQTSRWDSNSVNKPGMGFGDYFNPENLSYDPSYESQTLSNEQDVGRINNMVRDGYNVVSPMAPAMSVDGLDQPQVGFDSPSYSVNERGEAGAGDGFGNPYGPQGFGPDPSGTNGIGGFGSGMGGDVGGPGGPNTVGGYFDGGFHSTTPSYTPDTPTYDDGGFHNTSPTNTVSAPAVGFTSPTTPTKSFDEGRFSTPTYDDGGFHRGTPGSTSESSSGGTTSGGGGWGGW